MHLRLSRIIDSMFHRLQTRKAKQSEASVAKTKAAFFNITIKKITRNQRDLFVIIFTVAGTTERNHKTISLIAWLVC